MTDPDSVPLDSALGLRNRWLETSQLVPTDSMHAAHLGAFALQSRASRVRDLIAFGAGFQSFDEAVSVARTGKVADLSPTWLRELGRVAYQMPVEDYASLALLFFEAAIKGNPDIQFRDLDSLAYLEATLQIKGPEAVTVQAPRHRRMPEIEKKFLNIDLVGARHGYGSPEWLATLNSEVFESSRLSPVTLTGKEGSRFDRLSSGSVHKVVDGPLISVIMPTFRRQDEIRVAVDSILNQTWQNFELIIVDDASGEDFWPALQELGLLDPRITVMQMEKNGGAYVGRNAALRRARGEYVTFQDDDDWSHPERLERQVAALMQNEDVALTLSLCARATSDLSFRYRGAPVVRRNASSVMFRREVTARVGFYDIVRKAADSEYIERLLVLTGGRQQVVEEVLALVRLSTGSLSRADFSVGWQHPARVEYRESFRNFHRDLESGRAEINGLAGARQFPAPRRILGSGATETAAPAVDILILADWREVGATTQTRTQLVSDLADAQYRVGIAHVADVRLGGKGQEPISLGVRRLIASERIVRVLPDDVVSVATLVIDDAGVLESVANDEWACSVKSVVLVARGLPEEVSSEGTWSVGRADSEVRQVFAPSNVAWRADCDEVISAVQRLGIDAPRIDLRGAAIGSVNPSSDHTSGPMPRVGSYLSRGAPLPVVVKELLLEMCQPLMADIRLYSGAAGRNVFLASPDASWLMYRSTDVRFTDYLRQLDFFVLVSSDRHLAEGVDAALQAAAVGCVVIADPGLKPFLGDAATYCDLADMPSTMFSIFSDERVYREQAERARSSCQVLRLRHTQEVENRKLSWLQ